MARGAAEGADDCIGAERLADRAHRAGAVGEVDAVEPVPLGELKMALDHQRHVALVRHRAKRVGGAGEPVRVAGREGQPEAGHGRRVERRSEPRQKRLEHKVGRRDEVDLRALSLGHAWFSGA